MVQSRREFIIKTFGAAVYTSLLTGCGKPETPFLILSASHSDAHRKQPKARDADPYFAVFDSRTNDVKVMKAPSLAHSIVQNPVDKNEFLCLPRIGKTAFIYNHKTNEFKPFESEEGLLFYGHGSYTKDGKSFYTSESVDSDKAHIANERLYYKGSVHKWTTKNLNIQSDLETYGFDPHDMVMLDQNTAVVANGGEDTNIAIVDLNKKSLIKKYKIDIPGIVCRHLVVDNKKNIYVLTAVNQKKGGKYCSVFYPKGEKLVPFGYNGGQNFLKTQLLSGISTDKYIVTAAPKMNAVHYWNKETKEIEKVDQIEQAAGVALSLDKQSFIVTSAYENQSQQFKASNNEPIQGIPKYAKLSGRHTYLYPI